MPAALKVFSLRITGPTLICTIIIVEDHLSNYQEAPPLAATKKRGT